MDSCSRISFTRILSARLASLTAKVKKTINVGPDTPTAEPCSAKKFNSIRISNIKNTSRVFDFTRAVLAATISQARSNIPENLPHLPPNRQASAKREISARPLF